MTTTRAHFATLVKLDPIATAHTDRERFQMTDLDPAIWDNPTLGAAANNPRLDAIEKQEIEDRNAKLEGREPLPVVVDNNYPGWTPDVNPRTGTVPSNAEVVHFADDVPADPNADPILVDENQEPDGSSESSVPNSTPEGESTQWS